MAKQEIAQTAGVDYKGVQKAVLDVIGTSKLPSPFKEDMMAVWEFGMGLVPPENVRWQATHPKVETGSGLVAEISPADYAPVLEISALSVTQEDDNDIKSEKVLVPMAFNAAPRLEKNALRNYSIKRMVSREGSQEIHLDEPITLETYITQRLEMNGADPKIVKNIPVMDVIAFLPAPHTPGAYEVNIVPTMGGIGILAHYLVIQDKALHIGQVSYPNKGKRVLTDYAENNAHPYISASFVPDLNDFERLLNVPIENSGHLVIVSLPYTEPSKDQFSLDLGFRSSEQFGGPLKGGREIRIGDVAFGRGTDSGIKTRFVDLVYDPTEQPFIYHVVGLGIQRTQLELLTQDRVTGLFEKISPNIN